MKVVVPERWRDVVEQHGDWVAGEVLATELTAGDVDEPQIERT